ncbi:fibrinogen-like protein [Apostichopus japonicus]|uniref:Fibrinogen-like protein n=1 Tax=Stichopus japonicus TaxID=307972 RepID=A0A2G8JWR3_STIJA|nr:fibrinogen-like protein [Apostichopus japonicus]
MIYGPCSCQATCADPNGKSGCNSDCLGSEGCTCPAGFVIQGSDCISASECGCFVAEANLVIPSGETSVNEDCTQKCSCNNNRLICEDYICSTNAVCDVRNEIRKCYCNDGYAGDGEDCRSFSPRDCQDVYEAGRGDCVYAIMPTGWPESPFNVHCKMHSDGGWTVFQRRTDDDISFYQNWTAYKDGFGNSRNLWLGNEKLYYLTNQADYKLRLDITTSDGASIYSEFTEFQIESEDTNYKMNKLGSRTSPSGSAGYYLPRNRGKQFSTYDRDNDACDHYNCAEMHRSGWWHINRSYYCVSCYSSSSYCDRFQYNGNCHSVCTGENFNGDYNGGNGQNIYSDYYNKYCNVKSVEMKIRPSS